MKVKTVFQGRLGDAVARLEDFEHMRDGCPVGMIYAEVPPEHCVSDSMCEICFFFYGAKLLPSKGALVHFIDYETAKNVLHEGDLHAIEVKDRRLTAEERLRALRYYAANDAYVADDELFEK